MFKIKTLNSIAPVWQSILPADQYTVSADCEDMDAVMVRSADMHSFAVPESLRCVARAGAGVNNIPLDDMAEQGVVVLNTPGANANAVKELVLAALLLASRDIVAGIEWAKGLQGDDVGKQVEKGKSKFAGIELQGRTLGVIGLGGIGGLVANAAVSLGMNVLGYDPFISVENAWRLSRKVVHVASEAELYSHSDYITVHVPLMDATRGSIGAEAFSRMKEGAALLNFSRGEIVDTAALLEALDKGQLRRYVTDFPNAEILGHQGVIAIPHLGASTEESENNCVAMAAREIDAYLTTGAITHSVNFPDTDLPPAFRYRVAVLHRNLPNTVSAMTSLIGANGINIDSMVNRSRKQYAYTVFDLDEPLPEVVIGEIAAQENVLRVRTITRA